MAGQCAFFSMTSNAVNPPNARDEAASNVGGFLVCGANRTRTHRPAAVCELKSAPSVR